MSKRVFLAMKAQAKGKGLGLEEEEGCLYSGEGQGGTFDRWDPVRTGYPEAESLPRAHGGRGPRAHGLLSGVRGTPCARGSETLCTRGGQRQT